jgi:hypothetical protein
LKMLNVRNAVYKGLMLGGGFALGIGMGILDLQDAPRSAQMHWSPSFAAVLQRESDLEKELLRLHENYHDWAKTREQVLANDVALSAANTALAELRRTEDYRVRTAAARLTKESSGEGALIGTLGGLLFALGFYDLLKRDKRKE